VEIQEVIPILQPSELSALIFRKKRLTEKEKRLVLVASKQLIRSKNKT
jgi:alkylhydroperoxidase/carboxymuconolactone decarboxylase family protein YurZ